MKDRKSKLIKIGVIGLVLVMALSIAACSSGNNDNNVPMPELPEETPIVTPEPHIHRYEEVASIDPTCVEAGYKTTRCECGDEKTENLEALGHDYKAEVVAPTCTEAGYTIHTCSICNDSYTDTEVAALGHSVKSFTITKATCLENGKKEGDCVRCNELVTEVILPLDHNFVLTDDVKPGCKMYGYKRYVCSRCDDIYIDIIYALGHSYESVVTAPTCTEGGYTSNICKYEDCGDIIITQRTKALGHDYVLTERLDPTCELEGRELHICARCDKEDVRVIKALGHEYINTVVAPTCHSEGYTKHDCQRADCGYSYIDAKLGVIPHDCRLIVLEPTCLEAGMSKYECKDCDYTYVHEIFAAKGHNFATTVVNHTCTEAGYTRTACLNPFCEEAYVEGIDALGHDYKVTVYAPDCENIGYTDHVCQREDCNASYADEKIDALGHDYKVTVIAPTCAAKGYTQYDCQREDCGHSYKDAEVDALPHNCDVYVTEPTCEEMGYVTYVCKDCDHVSTGDYKFALGHDYVDGACQREDCGHLEPVAPAKED